MSQPTPKDLQLWHQLCEELETYPNQCATSEQLGQDQHPAWSLFGESPQAIRRRIWLREVHKIQLITYQPTGEWRLCSNWSDKLAFLEQVYLKGVDPLTLPQPWIAEVNTPLPNLSTTPDPPSPEPSVLASASLEMEESEQVSSPVLASASLEMEESEQVSSPISKSSSLETEESEQIPSPILTALVENRSEESPGETHGEFTPPQEIATQEIAAEWSLMTAVEKTPATRKINPHALESSLSALEDPLRQLRFSLNLLGDVARQWKHLQMTPHWENYVRQQCQAIASCSQTIRQQLEQWPRQ